MTLLHYYSHLKPYFSRYKINVLIILSAVVGVSFSLLLLGQYIKTFIEIISIAKTTNELYIQFLYIVATILGFAAFSAIRSYNIGILTENINCQIRVNIYSSLMKKDQSYFDRSSVNVILENISKGLKALEQITIDFLSFFLRNIILFIASIILMFYQNAKLFGIFIILMPIIVAPLFFLRKIIKGYNISFQEQNNAIFNITEESINNFAIVKSGNQVKNLIAKMKTLTNQILTFNKQRQKIRSFFFASVIFGVLSLIAVIALIGGIDVLNKEMHPASLLMFKFYAILMATSFIGILEPLMNISTKTEELDKLLSLMDKNKDNAIELNQEIEPTNYNILIEDLIFSYDNKAKNLVNINIAITEGSFIGITGPSGSGKSSLLKVILNLYPDNYNGNVYVGSVNLRYVKNGESFQAIAYVPQNPMLFSLSIVDNIKFGAPDISDEELKEIIDIACLQDIVEQFGLHTILHNKSSQLSGGQKQQVAIARALASKPSILICDEATSAMDFNLENKILHNLLNYMKGKTVIYVAHRIASIKNADNIIVINNGLIVGTGTHMSLITNCNLYKELNKSMYD